MYNIIPLFVILGTSICSPVNVCDICGENKFNEIESRPAVEWAYVKDYYSHHTDEPNPFANIPSKFEWIQCQNCQTAMVTPKLEDDIVNTFYEEYFNNKYSEFIHNYQSDFRTIVFEHYFEKICKYSNKSGNFIDIGCADGMFMKLAKEHGFSAYGIDVASVITKAKEFGVVMNGDVLDCLKNFDDNFFDIVTIVDAIEHFRSPNDVIELVSKKLKKGGIVFIETPNFDADNKPDRMSRHFHLFNKTSIKFLLEKNGLAVEEISQESGQYNKVDQVIHDRFLICIGKKK